MMRKLKAGEFQRMPWKNGGGETQQIAIGPAGATVDNFDWRVSTAQVATAGPFSAFLGIDRSLAVLSGQGLMLVTASGAATQERPQADDIHRPPPEGDEQSNPVTFAHETLLTPESPAYSFSGEAPASAALVADDPVVDFNVMTRRSRFRHSLRHLNLPDEMQIAADVLVLYCIEGQLDCHDLEDPGASPLPLAAGEALVAQPQPMPGVAGERGAALLRLQARGTEPTRLWVVQLFSVSRSDV